MFVARQGAAPRTIIAEARTDRGRRTAKHLAATYVAGAYAEDPIFDVLSTLGETSVWAHEVRTLPPNLYRATFWDEPGLAHELVLTGAVDGSVYYVSFQKGCGSPAFTPCDCQRMTTLAELALRTLSKHEGLAAISPGMTANCSDRERMLGHLQARLLLEPASLSHREAEVCAGIILGYTTLGLSLKLGISQNTVATHRKRAYTKLQVCSSNELFIRYFQAVEGVAQRHLN